MWRPAFHFPLSSWSYCVGRVWCSGPGRDPGHRCHSYGRARVAVQSSLAYELSHLKRSGMFLRRTPLPAGGGEECEGEVEVSLWPSVGGGGGGEAAC